MTTPITDLDAETLARCVSRQELDPVDVADAFVARILERSAPLMALVNYYPAAVREDATRVRDRVRAGEVLPLAGVPVVIKDNIWVKGYRITQGSRLFADFIAPVDAIAVERLRAAGAVVIGIGACPEFACTGMTASPLYGPTRHPADPRLTPGGSSGGNAVALAERLAPLAIGTDAGGSGRRPAAHCGLVGFKPTQGAIPYVPGFVEPFVGTCVMAPMGRTVSDVSLLFSALAGPDIRDPESAMVPADQPTAGRTPRIAYSPRFGLDVPIDADVVVCIETAIARIRDAGISVERTDPVWPEGAAESGLTPIHEAGLGHIYGAQWRSTPERFDPVVGAQIELGLRRTGAEVAAALALSAAVRKSVAAFFGDYDLLIGPTAPCVSWPHDRLGPEFIGGVAVPPRGHAVFTPLFNHAQTPAISIPCGTGRDGLPVGLQIVGPRGADRQVLAFAERVERLVAA